MKFTGKGWLKFLAVLGWNFLLGGSLLAMPPRENPYDVIGKVMQPFWGVLLSDTKGPIKAATLTITLSEVSGRLPSMMAGATLDAAVEFPDKVRLSAPVFGEMVIVCRNGDEVWATPGAKVEFLLKQFKDKPKPTRKTSTPIYLPITPQQAIFLPAIFSVENAGVAQIGELNGEMCRVITGGLMPELAKALRAEGFRVRMWVGEGYLPRRFEIFQPDFTAVADISNLKFARTLPQSLWEPPINDGGDIYRTHADLLDAVLFVVMNSLELKKDSEAGD